MVADDRSLVFTRCWRLIGREGLSVSAQIIAIAGGYCSFLQEVNDRCGDETI
jgi:hypothetical protein